MNNLSNEILLENNKESKNKIDKETITDSIIKKLDNVYNLTEINRIIIKNIDNIPPKERIKNNNLLEFYIKKTKNTPQFTDEMLFLFLKKGFKLNSKSLSMFDWRFLSSKFYNYNNFSFYKYLNIKNKKSFLKNLISLPIIFKYEAFKDNISSIKINENIIKLESVEYLKCLFLNKILFNLNLGNEVSLKEFLIFLDNIQSLTDSLIEKKYLSNNFYKDILDNYNEESLYNLINSKIKAKDSMINNIEEKLLIKKEIIPHLISFFEKNYMNNQIKKTSNTKIKKRI